MPQPRTTRPIPRMADEVGVGRWGQMLRENLRENRPKMFLGLRRAGTLHQYLVDQERMAAAEIHQYVLQGATVAEAEEVVLPQYILLPSEKDQPELGGPVNPEAPQSLPRTDILGILPTQARA